MTLLVRPLRTSWGCFHSGLGDGKSGTYGNQSNDPDYERPPWERSAGDLCAVCGGRGVVGRGGVDRRLWDQGGNELRELTRVVAILAIRLRGIETKLVEDDRLAAHLDYVEGETDDLRSMIQRVDARIDGLVAMLTARREGGGRGEAGRRFSLRGKMGRYLVSFMGAV